MSTVRRAATLCAGAAAYLGVGLIAWWHVWTGGAAHTLTSSGWGDPAQQIWFTEWVPHALGAGLNPFVSHAMFAPGGINLMANSSILFPAFAVSPVTVLFGPVVGFNVLVVVAPAVSAFAAWRVFDRYTTFGFGAWLAGFFYGFSPFVVNDLADGHLHVTLLVFPPLVLALLDDIAVSERGSPVRRGLLLGLVLAAQALTSLEVLAMTVFMSAVGLAALAIFYRSEVRARLRRVGVGLLSGALSAGVLLAWPLEVLFTGPRRYHGSVFTSPESYVVWLKALVWPRGGTPPAVWAAYVGLPLILVVIIGVIRLRSAVLRLSAVLAAVALVAAMGRTLHLTPKLSTGVWLPDRLITKMPFLDNVLPVRFMIFVDLFLALGLAVVLGSVRDYVAARRGPNGRKSGLVAAVCAGALGVGVIASPALGAPWPYSTRQLAEPAVYRSAAITRLRSGSILLAYPVMNGFEADPMIWQARAGMPYSMVAGYGFVPSNGPHPLGSLPPSPVTTLFGDAEVGLLSPTISPARAAAVRNEIRAWQVTDIVVENVGKRPRYLVGILTRLLRQRPRLLDGAWVWLGLHQVGSR